MLPVLVALVANLAMGDEPDWRLVALTGNAGSQIAYFADYRSIRRTGGIVLVDEIRETERPDAAGNTTSRIRMEYDCRLRVAGVLASQSLDAAGTMIVVSDPLDRMTPVSIDTPAEDRLRFACHEARGLGAVRDTPHQTALRLFASRANFLRAYPGNRAATSSRD